MTECSQVAVEPAMQHDATVVANLMELYSHDLSAAFSLELGTDGRFGYERLPLYWSEPEQRFAFLIRCEGRVVGFVLATRGCSPLTADPELLDIAEFFVLRRYRRSGVGRRAAFLLWNRLPGTWTVRVSERNPSALSFWSGVIAEFSSGTATQSTQPGNPNPWRVFSFESAAATA